MGLKKRAAMQTHSSSQKGFMKSRGQAVGAAEQELGVLDAQAAQQHGQAVDAQTKAAVGRAAVLEELQIELDVLGQTLLLSLFFSTS